MKNFNDYAGFWGTVSELVEQAKILSKAMGMSGEKLSERLIRYYATEGVLDKPDRLGRDAAYHFRHLLQLLTARRLADEGVPLAAIGQFNLSKTTTELAQALLKSPKEEAVGVSTHYRSQFLESKEKSGIGKRHEPLEEVLTEIRDIQKNISLETQLLEKTKSHIECLIERFDQSQSDFYNQMKCAQKELEHLSLSNFAAIRHLVEENNVRHLEDQQKQIYFIKNEIKTAQEEILKSLGK